MGKKSTTQMEILHALKRLNDKLTKFKHDFRNKISVSSLIFGQILTILDPSKKKFHKPTDTIKYMYYASNYQPKLTLKVWSLFASIVQWLESVLFPKFWFPVKDVFSMLLGFKSSERKKNFSLRERFC